MRVVMLSCNTGEGHNSTARAIQDVLEERGVECELIDVLACFSPGISKFVSKSHTNLYKYAPKLWDVGYRAIDHREQNAYDRMVLYDLLSLGTQKLWRILTAGNYDAAVCVHMFSGMMMTELRRQDKTRIPCYFVATDYSCCPYVDCCEMDGYFIPAKDLEDEFISAGLPAEKLIPSGIPVRQAFYHRGSRETARNKLKLSSEALVVLLMCGSMGVGPMKKIARELTERLPENATVIAMCGKNQKLYESMSEICDPRLTVLGYNNLVSDYMDAADMIVTKPGGLSSTEAANKHLPIVFINAVGGCESRNFNFFLNRGFAVGSSEADKVLEQAVELAYAPHRLDTLRKNLEDNFKTNSAVMIAEIVMDAALFGRINPDVSGNPSFIKGGEKMEQSNKNTIINLARSFAGESQARSRYTVYAKVARDEGWEWIARIFEETAANESVHAEEFLEMICTLGGSVDNLELTAGYPFQLGTTQENLAFAAAGELHEHDMAYPEFARQAREEGLDAAARLWLQIARVEGVHHNTFRSLKEQMESGTLVEKQTPILWRCLNCGFTYEAMRASDLCPVCEKSRGWQEGELDRKNLIPKK